MYLNSNVIERSHFLEILFEIILTTRYLEGWTESGGWLNRSNIQKLKKYKKKKELFEQDQFIFI